MSCHDCYCLFPGFEGDRLGLIEPGLDLPGDFLVEEATTSFFCLLGDPSPMDPYHKKFTIFIPGEEGAATHSWHGENFIIN